VVTFFALAPLSVAGLRVVRRRRQPTIPLVAIDARLPTQNGGDAITADASPSRRVDRRPVPSA
jgi:hypothetical protein